MRVLVTGASGFIGRYLTDSLLRAPAQHQVLGITRSRVPEPGPERRLTWRRCDLCAEPAAFVQIVREWLPDAICHLAAESSAATLDRDAVMTANVDATRCVFDAARTVAPQTRVVLASTGYVYGSCDLRRPAREEDPVAAPETMGPYALSKLRAEAVAAEHRSASVIVRTFNCTGPGQDARFAIARFCRSISLAEAGRLDCIEVGNLSTMRDLSDVRDVAEAYRLLIEQGVAGETVNVASGSAQSMRQYLDMLMAMSAARVPVVSSRADGRPGDIAVSVGDGSRLRSLTGWVARFALEQTLRDTLEYWRGRL